MFSFLNLRRYIFKNFTFLALSDFNSFSTSDKFVCLKENFFISIDIYFLSLGY